MKANNLVFVLGAALAAASFNAAAEDWMVRVRVVEIDTANKSDPIGALGVPADAIHVSRKAIPEFDVSYFFTPNWAAELVLTYPQKHDVTIEGVGSIGSFKHLPPTLTAQYHFLPGGQWQPYVGAGVNFTNISNVNLAVPGVGSLNLDRTSVGLAYGAGFDYKVGPNLYINADVKKVYIGSDVTLGGTKISRVNVDPILWGLGLGWKF